MLFGFGLVKYPAKMPDRKTGEKGRAYETADFLNGP
jgi:hypothetical protein